MGETGDVVNLDFTILNRLTSVVRRLCDAEVQMKALKSEFKELKNEVASLAGTILNDGTETRALGSTAGASVVTATEIIKEEHVLIVSDITITSDPEPKVLNEQSTKRSSPVCVTEETACKKQKVDNTENINVPGESVPDDKDYVEVFACGECENNGMPWGRAGLGVFFETGSVMNCSRPIEGSKTTHNAASIDACIQALRLGIEYGIKKMKIFIESEFAHNCITKWMAVWKENNWKTFTGGKVKFRNELERLDKLASHFERIKWTLETDDVRIQEAKNLARTGAMKYVRIGYC